jgi:signal transduction histidine kinase
LVAVPLRSADRVVGAFVVRRRQPGVFDDEVCDLLSAFASQSAVALTNARLYQELARQSLELTIASQHKSEFLASMSHELRTPLNAVIGFSEVLLERMFGDLNERQEDYLQDIHSAGRHLLALLGDILDLSKIEAGRMELDCAPIDLPHLFAETTELLRERVATKGLTLTTDADDVAEITADRRKLTQVLFNLVTNAIKFTPSGGHVTLTARRIDTQVALAVADTGIGISKEDQGKLFQVFTQVDGSLARRHEGTGLGLALTRRLVELHGGSISVRSAPGAGSTFTVILPSECVAAPPQRRALDDHHAPDGGATSPP